MDLGLILKAVIVSGAVAIGLASTWLFKLPNDNPIEQVAETVIKQETGEDIDLTPGK